MNQKLSQIFKEISQVEPEANLADLVLEKIALEKSRSIKRKLFVSYAGLASSLAVGIWAIVSLGNVILKSEFWSILSLLFSDAQIVAGYWKEYLYSLGETLPFLSLAVMLVPIFGIILSIGYFWDLKHKSKNFYSNHFKLA